MQLKVELERHQKELLGWWEQKLFQNNLNGNIFIGDDQGLGKTVEALAVVEKSGVMEKGGWGLVIAPNSVKENWLEEIKNKLDGVVAGVISKVDKRAPAWFNKMVDVGTPAVAIVNYEKLLKLLEFVQQYRSQITPPKFVIVDESHYVKNRQSKRFKALYSLLVEFQQKELVLSRNKVRAYWELLLRAKTETPADREYLDFLRERVRGFLQKDYLRLYNPRHVEIWNLARLAKDGGSKQFLTYLLEQLAPLVLNPFALTQSEHKQVKEFLYALKEAGVSTDTVRRAFPNNIQLVINLTGTPVNNDIGELWTQLTILGYSHFFGPSWGDFVRNYTQIELKQIRDTFIEVVKPPTPEKSKQLYTDLHKICFIRRTKEQLKTKLGLKSKNIHLLPTHTQLHELMLYVAMFLIPYNIEEAKKLTDERVRGLLQEYNLKTPADAIREHIYRTNWFIDAIPDLYRKLERYLEAPHPQLKKLYDFLTFKARKSKDESYRVEEILQFLPKMLAGKDQLDAKEFLLYSILTSIYFQFWLFRVYRVELKSLYEAYRNKEITFQEFNADALRLINRLRQYASIAKIPFTAGVLWKALHDNPIEELEQHLKQQLENIPPAGQEYLKEFFGWIYDKLFNGGGFPYHYKFGDFDKPVLDYIQKIGNAIKAKYLTTDGGGSLQQLIELAKSLYRLAIEIYIPLKDKSKPKLMTFFRMLMLPYLEFTRQSWIAYLLETKSTEMAEYMMKIYRGESSMTPYKRENDYLNDLVNAMLVFEQKGGLPINGIETPATRTKKGIVFTNFKIVLRLLEQTLKWLFPDVEIFRITADLKPNQRLDVVNQFNNYDGKAVLLASLKTANVGLNITGGKFIVFQDFDFNPQNMNQAEDRIYRIGQYEDVHIYYPIVVNGGIELPVFLTVMEKFLVHLGVVEGKHITTKVGGGSNYLKELIKWL